jgi:hypothetical protein
MWLLPFAHAGELPWECPEIASPADMKPYDHDAGLGDAVDELEALAMGWWEEGCDWEVVSESYTTVEQSCVTSAGAAVSLVTYADEDVPDWVFDETTLTVVPPEGAETWGSMVVVRSVMVETAGGAAETETTQLLVTWTGSIDGYPSDGEVEILLQPSFDHGITRDYARYATPGCVWGWSTDSQSAGSETRFNDGHSVRVTYQACGHCGCGINELHFDDELYGHVDHDTWLLAEGDADGYPVESGDCDDTDPAVHPCADDVAHDGLDQDCDGADSLDGDRDRHDASFAGGDDCDDDDDAVHPGADDAAGDGLDRDCDGADDADVDGDGFTADGDDHPPDCDDDDAGVNPDADEVAGDGIDQNCDGLDLPADEPDPDTGVDVGDSSAPADEDDETREKSERRCGGGSALLAFGALARRRRR